MIITKWHTWGSRANQKLMMLLTLKNTTQSCISTLSSRHSRALLMIYYKSRSRCLLRSLLVSSALMKSLLLPSNVNKSIRVWLSPSSQVRSRHHLHWSKQTKSSSNSYYSYRKGILNLWARRNQFNSICLRVRNQRTHRSRAVKMWRRRSRPSKWKLRKVRTLVQWRWRLIDFKIKMI